MLRLLNWPAVLRVYVSRVADILSEQWWGGDLLQTPADYGALGACDILPFTLKSFFFFFFPTNHVVCTLLLWFDILKPQIVDCFLNRLTLVQNKQDWYLNLLLQCHFKKIV